jgi:hypothetical protein
LQRGLGPEPSAGAILEADRQRNAIVAHSGQQQRAGVGRERALRLEIGLQSLDVDLIGGAVGLDPGDVGNAADARDVRAGTVPGDAAGCITGTTLDINGGGFMA